MRRIELSIQPGQVYRPKDFAACARNPTVVLERLVRQEKLVKLGHGLYYCPQQGRFGPRPPETDKLLSAFLDRRPFVRSGPEFWNGLRLGPTGLAAKPMVYNAVRSGELRVGQRTFLFRRVPFPLAPNREWYAVDLLNNARQVGAAFTDLATALTTALRESRLHPGSFFDAVDKYGTRATKKLVREELDALRP